MDIRLEFDDSNKPLAAALGQALFAYGTGNNIAVLSVNVEPDAPAEDGDEWGELVGYTSDEPFERTPDPDDEPFEVGESIESAVQATEPTDENGVPFDEKFCSRAAEPLYASGKRKGQWKKRKGVSDKAYDEWYAAQGQDVPVTDDTQVDTAAAFGGQQDSAPTVPGNPGEFMVWVSELQAAGRLTQDDIAQAYSQTGTDISALFGRPQEEVEATISALHAVLSARAGQ